MYRLASDFRFKPILCAVAAVPAHGAPGLGRHQHASRLTAGRTWLAAVLLAWCCIPTAGAAPSTAAAMLQTKAQQLAQPLANNIFQRPVVLESTEASSELRGTIYAVVNHPFSDLRQALQSPGNWCEILMLHINTKYCAVQTGRGNSESLLAVRVGRKIDQPLEDAQEVVFGYRVQASEADYMDVRLSADEGPLSTKDYRIGLRATPLESGKSFIQLDYSYSYGAAARLAMQGYLATLGRGKVGFTPAGNGNIGGVRGVVERNTMRYYLGIDVFLNSLKTPLAQQRDRRLTEWFDATEQYAKQLHEIDRNDYLAMKRREFERLATGTAAATTKAATTAAPSTN